MLMTLTWCNRNPAQSPSISCIYVICVEMNFYSVAPRINGWRQEIPVIRWFKRGTAAAVVHQRCPVPIGDFDIVAFWAGDDTGITLTTPDIKVGKLQFQCFPAQYFYCFCLVDIVRIVVRIVWGGDNTCKKLEVNNIFITKPSPLTLAATSFCRTKWVYRLPDWFSSGWIKNTSKAQPRWIWALAAAAVIADPFIFANVGFQVCAGAARRGKAAFWW